MNCWSNANREIVKKFYVNSEIASTVFLCGKDVLLERFCLTNSKKMCTLVHILKIKRRWWDSNPRAREGKTISSRSRYDHFDTSPYIDIVIILEINVKNNKR